MGRFHRLAEPPRQPTQNQGADGTRLPSARRCRRSARIPRRPARRLRKIPPVASKRAFIGPETQKIAWDSIWGDLATEADALEGREPEFSLPGNTHQKGHCHGFAYLREEY